MNKLTIAILSRDNRLYELMPLLKDILDRENLKFSPVYVDAKHIATEKSLAILNNADAILSSDADDAVSLAERHLTSELSIMPIFSVPQLKKCTSVNQLYVLPQSRIYGTQGNETLTETAITKKNNIINAIMTANIYSNKRKKQLTVVKSVFSSFYNIEFEQKMFNNRDTDSRIISNEFMIKEIIEVPSCHDVIIAESVQGNMLYRMTANLYSVTSVLPMMMTGSTNVFSPAETYRDWIDECISAEIFAAAMMLEYQFGLERASLRLRKAFANTLEKGFRTIDIAKEGEKAVSVSEMIKALKRELKSL